jgi:hypothetical protein
MNRDPLAIRNTKAGDVTVTESHDKPRTFTVARIAKDGAQSGINGEVFYNKKAAQARARELVASGGRMYDKVEGERWVEFT